MLARRARVGAVVAFSREDQNGVARLCEVHRVLGDGFPYTANHFGFGLSRGPGGFFPVTHLGDSDYRNCHGAELTRIFSTGKSLLSCFAKPRGTYKQNSPCRV